MAVIKVSVLDDAYEVEAEVYGQFAVHGSIVHNDEQGIFVMDEAFTVTHIKSGLSVQKRWSQDGARELAQGLAGIDVDAHFDEAVAKEIMKIIRAVEARRRRAFERAVGAVLTVQMVDRLWEEVVQLGKI